MLDKPAITVPNTLFFESIIEILALGKTAKFNLRGNSMRPCLYEGDQVVLVSISSIKLQVGQIVLAKYQNNYVLHRLVKIKNDQIWLAGDGNVAQVEIVTKTALIAAVKQVFREEKELIVTSRFQYMKGMLWYYSRPFRYIIKKIIGHKS
jgi:signal peptidase